MRGKEGQLTRQARITGTCNGATLRTRTVADRRKKQPRYKPNYEEE